jgi:hypothetical protein
MKKVEVFALFLVSWFVFVLLSFVFFFVLLKQQNFIFSQLWQMEVPSQVVSRV